GAALVLHPATTPATIADRTEGPRPGKYARGRGGPAGLDALGTDGRRRCLPRPGRRGPRCSAPAGRATACSGRSARPGRRMGGGMARGATRARRPAPRSATRLGRRRLPGTAAASGGGFHPATTPAACPRGGGPTRGTPGAAAGTVPVARLRALRTAAGAVVHRKPAPRFLNLQNHRNLQTFQSRSRFFSLLAVVGEPRLLTARTSFWAVPLPRCPHPATAAQKSSALPRHSRMSGAT